MCARGPDPANTTNRRLRGALVASLAALTLTACAAEDAKVETTGAEPQTRTAEAVPPPASRAGNNLSVEDARALDALIRATGDPEKLPPEGYLRYAAVDGSGTLDVKIDEIPERERAADREARQLLDVEARADIRFVFGALNRETFGAINALVCKVEPGAAGQVQICDEDAELTKRLRDR